MMMKAVALLKDGSAEITDIARPEAKRGEVLVRVEYSALDSAYEEVASRTFIPGSLLHNLRASPLVAGWHFSGTVEGTGDGTAGLKVGDEGETCLPEFGRRPPPLFSFSKSTKRDFPIRRGARQCSDTSSTTGRLARGASPSTSLCPRTSAPRSPTGSP